MPTTYIPREKMFLVGQTSFQVYVQGYGRNSRVLTSRTSIRGSSLTHLIISDREHRFHESDGSPTRESKDLA